MIEKRINGYYALSEKLIQITLAFFDETERAPITMQKDVALRASPLNL